MRILCIRAIDPPSPTPALLKDAPVKKIPTDFMFLFVCSLRLLSKLELFVASERQRERHGSIFFLRMVHIVCRFRFFSSLFISECGFKIY